MTTIQEKKIEAIRKFMNNLMGKYSDEYETKSEEIQDIGYGYVMFYMQVGMKGDEGTMAAVFGRDTIHVTIGPKGGMSCPCKSKKDGKHIEYTDTMTGVLFRSMEYHRS